MTTLPKHLLPDSLLQIAEYCDEATMWAILGEYGGGHLWVPVAVNPEHRLSVLLGHAAACKFCEAFGGEYFRHIPNAAAARREIRDEQIRSEAAAGADNFTLCRKYGLSERAIIRIKGQDKPVPLNFDLFE